MTSIWTGKNYKIKPGRNKQYIIRNNSTGMSLYVVREEDIEVHPEVGHEDYYYIMKDLDEKYFAIGVQSYILIERLMSGWNGGGVWIEGNE